jgi:uncharacterized protein YrrD
MDRMQDLRGAPVYSSERERIGSVEHVYFNVQSNEPEWLAVGAGILSNRYSMVPLRGAAVEQDGIIVPFTKDQVKDSPDVAPDAISEHLERELWTYYGRHADWGQQLGPEYGPEYQQPAQPGQHTGYEQGPGDEQGRVRRWQWEHTQR